MKKMEKKISEMSLEELWKLFPIYLTEHQPYWKEWYTEEENFLKNRVSGIERISHIGSTAVSSIWAKPIIDILVEVSEDDKLANYKEIIMKSGYICMSETFDRISFNKGYTEKGFAEKVFHLHLRHVGDNDELSDCFVKQQSVQGSALGLFIRKIMDRDSENMRRPCIRRRAKWRKYYESECTVSDLSGSDAGESGEGI